MKCGIAHWWTLPRNLPFIWFQSQPQLRAGVGLASTPSTSFSSPLQAGPLCAFQLMFESTCGKKPGLWMAFPCEQTHAASQCKNVAKVCFVLFFCWEGKTRSVLAANVPAVLVELIALSCSAPSLLSICKERKRRRRCAKLRTSKGKHANVWVVTCFILSFCIKFWIPCFWASL